MKKRSKLTAYRFCLIALPLIFLLYYGCKKKDTSANQPVLPATTTTTTSSTSTSSTTSTTSTPTVNPLKKYEGTFLTTCKTRSRNGGTLTYGKDSFEATVSLSASGDYLQMKRGTKDFFNFKMWDDHKFQILYWDKPIFLPEMALTASILSK